MKVFLSSTYVDLVEHRKAACEENHPRITTTNKRTRPSSIRVFVNYSWTVYLKTIRQENSHESLPQFHLP